MRSEKAPLHPRNVGGAALSPLPSHFLLFQPPVRLRFPPVPSLMFRKKESEPPLLTSRFQDALTYASRIHAAQVRKGSRIPYISHLLGVASLVIEAEGDEDQAIAALLHDAVEDQPRGGKTVKHFIAHAAMIGQD